MRMTKIKTIKNKTEENLARVKKIRTQISKAMAERNGPRYGPPNFKQQHPDPEVDNWQNHVKHHIFQHKYVNDQHLETSS